MAIVADRVVVELEAKLDAYDAKIAGAERQFDKSMSGIAKSAGAMEVTTAASFARLGTMATAFVGTALTAAAAAGAALIVQLVKNIADLKDHAAELGMSTTALQEYRYAAESAGVDQAKFEDGVKSLTEKLRDASLGAEKPLKVFNALGINIRDASGEVRDAASVLPELADKLNSIPDPTERAAVAALLLGDNASEMAALLDQGSEGIDNLRDAAERLGVVLSADQIQRADEVAQKLRDVRVELSYDVTSFVADNADAIMDLATAFATVAKEALGAITAVKNFHNVRVINSAIASEGQKLTAVKQLASTKSGRAALLEDLDKRIAQNRSDRTDGRGNRRGVVSLLGFGGLSDSATPESNARLDREYANLQRQRNAVMRIENAEGRRGQASSRPVNPTGVRSLLAPKPARGRRARKPPEDRTDEYQARFENALARLQDEYLSALADETQSAQDRLAAAEARIETQRASYQRSVEVDDRLTAAQKKALIAANDKVAAQERSALAAREEARIAEERLDSALGELRNAEEIEQLAGQLVETREARRASELRLLDLQFEEERARLEAVLAAKQATEAEKEIARRRLALLPELKGRAAEGINRQHESPMERYRRELRGDFESINDQLENIEVQGLRDLEDSLVRASKKALGLKGALGDVVGELIRIGIQRQLIGPLADALFGGAGGGGGGAIGSLIGSIFGGGRATGGPVSSSKMYMVGEKGPELFVPGSNGTIVPQGKAIRPVAGAVATARPQITVISAPTFDLRHAITTPQLMREVDRISQVNAQRAAVAMGQGVLQAVPSRMSQFQTDGS